MTHEEKKQNTYIASAELLKHKVAQRDWLVRKGEEAGFLVDCTEAIPISFSGNSGPEIWSITYYAKGALSREERNARREVVNGIFREYKATQFGK